MSANQCYRLLLVEDSPVNRMVMAKTLHKLGYIVLAVADGDAALAELARVRYDLILLDLNLPGCNGYQIAAAVRNLASSQQCSIPIIAVTAELDPDVKQRCRAAGIAVCLPKPLPGPRLAAAVAAQLGQFSGLQAESAVLDEDCLVQLQEDTDAQTLFEAVQIFVQETRIRLAAMQIACQQQDWQGLQREAHTLKSSAALFGAHQVQQYAQQLSAACEQQQWHTAIALSAALSTVVEPVLDALSKRFLVDKTDH